MSLRDPEFSESLEGFEITSSLQSERQAPADQVSRLLLPLAPRL
jgi:hypothetical protein